MRFASARAAVVGAALSLAGCGVDTDPFPPGCHDASANANLAGTWVLTGSGTRESCSSADLDGGFELRSGTPLEVRQAPAADGKDALALEAPVVPDGGTFGFSGVVDRACVAFTLTETSSGETLSFDCTGAAEATTVSGTFRGTGPAGCTSHGTFELGVTLRDDCSPQPCQNGGLCTDGPYGFVCTCPAGWAGLTCADIDHCTSHPCENGGTCVSDASGFTCDCPPGWIGPTCSEVDNCEPDPCLNGGRCLDGTDTFTCVCPAGLEGTTCEIDVDECARGLASCATVATCTNTVGSFECTCPEGMTGDGVTCTKETVRDLLGCQAVDPPAWAALTLVVLAWRLWGRRRRGAERG